MAYRYICMEAEIVSMVTRKQLYGIQLCAELKPPPYIIKDVHTQLLPYYTKKRMMRPYSAVHNSVIRCALVPVNRIKATSIHNKGRPYTIITVLYKKRMMRPYPILLSTIQSYAALWFLSITSNHSFRGSPSGKSPSGSCGQIATGRS